MSEFTKCLQWCDQEEEQEQCEIVLTLFVMMFALLVFLPGSPGPHSSAPWA